MLKVGVWLNEKYHAQEGGGYSYYSRLIAAMDSFQFDPRVEVVFISAHKQSFLKKPVVYVGSISILTSLLHKLTRFIPFASLKFKIIQFAYKGQVKKLKKNNVDIIYYPIQEQQVIPFFPFIATNWDIGHCSTYPFPEFMGGSFEDRERWYKQQLPQAMLIFAESEAGKKELIHYLHLNPLRIKVVPLFGGDYKVADEAAQKEILHTFNLHPQKFYFYPAQFWSHKNHYLLVNAFQKITLTHPDLKLVFTGSDKGNMEYIKTMCRLMGITDKVLFAGFVTSAELYTLYRNAVSLVMPSYLGPTNMPLLEAWELDCPVICSDLEGHREIMGDNAFYFNPDNAEELIARMYQILDAMQRQQLLKTMASGKSSSVFKVEVALQKIQEHLIDLIAIRKTWKY